MRSRLLRRDLFKVGAGAFAASLLPACDPPPEGCLAQPTADVPLGANENWIRGARVAGLATYGDATVCEIRSPLDQYADEGVSVVEIDADLSLYLGDDDFENNLQLIDIAARECHRRGMRAVAYYPVLEALTPKADQSGTRTIWTDHPDWVQLFLDGKPNRFIGTGANGLVFWVEKGEESAWLCPTSGYVDYFLARVERLVRETALDGLWADVPLLSDIATDGIWPCTNATCRAKFAADNPGFSLPANPPDSFATFDNPTFRKWVLWRHRIIRDLEQQIVKRAKAVRPEFSVVIETVTLDYDGGTLQGLDGAADDDGAIFRVWEIDAVSDATAMRNAGADDWISMAVMARHARGATFPRPTWAFSYGAMEDDAERVMAVVAGAGVSPYETKIPELGTSVGHDFRKRMFTWLGAHPEIFASPTAHDVGVLYSSASRDALYPYVGGGSGLYTTTKLPAGEKETEWWSTADVDQTKNVPYVGDYRGVCKMLFASRVPYDVVTTPHADAATLGRYKMIVAPSPVALSPSVVSTLAAYVNAGGTLLVTGSDGGAYTDAGDPVAQPALLQALGLLPAPRAFTQKSLGRGRVLLAPTRAGLAYFGGDTTLATQVAPYYPAPRFTANAPASTTVIFDLRVAADGRLLLLMTNLTGLGTKAGAFTPQDATFDVSLPTNGKSASVTLSRPEASDAPLKVTANGGNAVFSVSVRALALATIRLA